MALLAVLNPSFFLGIILILYLFSFALFAVVRIASGVSIQRIGYLSLRRIAYTPREGVRVEIYGISLHLHRPTFSKPTWASIRFSGIKVVVDAKILSSTQNAKAQGNMGFMATCATKSSSDQSQKSPPRRRQFGPSRESVWKALIDTKEKIKNLHRRIDWLRSMDIEMVNSSCVIIGVASVQIASMTIALDTRRRAVDRGRLFRHNKATSSTRKPAEWTVVLKSVLFTPNGKESLQVLDICSLKVHGLLYENVAGLRDASISLKLGHIQLPYDDILASFLSFKHLRSVKAQAETLSLDRKHQLDYNSVERDRPGSSQNFSAKASTSEFTLFVSSLLRGIQEIQLAISFIGISKAITSSVTSQPSIYLNFTMNEIGLDLFRLDPKSPAHRMYFSADDIAHQALIAAISIGISIDDDSGKPERILYVPMATATVKTTLPSKAIMHSATINVVERNTNVLFSNLVLTSPSLDLNMRSLTSLLTIFSNQPKPRASSQRKKLVTTYLPRANIKISIQEPVARLVLTPLEPYSSPDEYDLLISTVSSISLDVESSHSSIHGMSYSLISKLLVSSQRIYHQAASGDKHDLILLDSLQVKVQVYANPNTSASDSPSISVSAEGSFEKFSARMISSETQSGLQQISPYLHELLTSKSPSPNSAEWKPNFLSRLPSWLNCIHLRGSTFEVEVGGSDLSVPRGPRGMAVRVDSWTLECKTLDDDSVRPTSRFAQANDDFQSAYQSNPYIEPAGDKSGHGSDLGGRSLDFCIHKSHAYIAENAGSWESEPFLSLPGLVTSIFVPRGTGRPLVHVSIYGKTLVLRHSLYRCYAIGVALKSLREGLLQNNANKELHDSASYPLSISGPRKAGLIKIEIKVALIQIEATMPADPPVLLQMHGTEIRHGGQDTLFLKCRNAGLFSRFSTIKRAWARLITLRSLMFELLWRLSSNKHDRLRIEQITIASESTRLSVPHQIVLYKILDNFINTFKALQQLQHRFKPSSGGCEPHKGPVGPKDIPRISFRTGTLMFELEDGSFDWKLGLIYRVGLHEQKQRLAREEAFKMKIKRLGGKTHLRESSRFPTALNDLERSSASGVYGSSLNSRASRASETNAESEQIHSRPSNHFEILGIIGGFEGAAKSSALSAWEKLNKLNSTSWRRRIDSAKALQANAMERTRVDMGFDDEFAQNPDQSLIFVSSPRWPGLMTATFRDLHVEVNKPSFPIEDLPEFLKKNGKGMPIDMDYSLLIPLGLQIKVNEVTITLRNYPLPLLHVPPLRTGGKSGLSSFSLKTNFVIAEEFCREESVKLVNVEIVPSTKFWDTVTDGQGLTLTVQRTVSPVKTYSDILVSISSSSPTTIAWGTSYQPAIQDMMQIVESFTRPQADPSDRVGFWDKIRLICHSRVRISWEGEGNVHLRLKGSRDPFNIVGHGAGFVMCFRRNVQWDIHQDDDPRKFMAVNCGEYILAVPNYSSHIRLMDKIRDQFVKFLSDQHHQSSELPIFKKVIMKLNGNVRWVAGLVFERDSESGGRTFDSVPHYQVVLRTPQYAKSSNGMGYDAFRGFRSQYIHLSVAVIAPLDRDWSVTNLKPSPSYNSMHMSPRFFTHFFDWWALFSGVMSLPIRHGTLFPGIEKSTKKFGRHLATIKYNLLLSPIFISHIYKHKDEEGFDERDDGATGLKCRIDSFMLDLHQRREDLFISSKKLPKATKTSGMRINQTQLDFISADIRAVSATTLCSSSEDIARAADKQLTSAYEPGPSIPDISNFKISDNDTSWIDMDDFVELDMIIPNEDHLETSIMPLAFSPRFTYFRQTDHQNTLDGGPIRVSTFGEESTHFCIMSQDNDPLKVQHELTKGRIHILKDQLEKHQSYLGEHDQLSLQMAQDPLPPAANLREFEQQCRTLSEKISFMEGLLERMNRDLKEIHATMPRHDAQGELRHTKDLSQTTYAARQIESSQATESANDFDNRFVIHDMQLKWNNSLRNIILRYVHQVGQRRGFVYYMSRRAVKFIIDTVQEQQRGRANNESRSDIQTPMGESSASPSGRDTEGDENLEARINDILSDGKNFVDANDSHKNEWSPLLDTQQERHKIASSVVAQNSYHLRLIAPQIQLQSEKNETSVLLVAAENMQLKVVQIMDRNQLADDVSGLVQRRFSLDMDGVQFFVTTKGTFEEHIDLYSANRYGCFEGSAWPPWAPIEVNFDFNLNPFGWSRVVQKTSASLQYDKYNTLRLKSNDDLLGAAANTSKLTEDIEKHIDHLWVEFPHIRAVCDSNQYYAMYVIVLDLLLYSEPLEKIRSEKLEKIMLAADFSDLTGAPEMIVRLQEKIRRLEEVKLHFQIHYRSIDRRGWYDYIQVERALAACENELFLMMKAISTSQRRFDEQSPDSQSNGLLRWYLSASEIVWHLMKGQDSPLMEIQLKHASYDRRDNSDGSNYNVMEIEKIHGLNLLPNALYPDMIAPYFERSKSGPAEVANSINMFRVQWYMLEAIAGIPVLDQFEINLFPLKIQLEREVGKQLFEYIFPSQAEGEGIPESLRKAANASKSEGDIRRVSSTHQISSTLVPDFEPSRQPTIGGSLEHRLKPTLTMSDPTAQPSRSNSSGRIKSTASAKADTQSFRILDSQTRSKSLARIQPSVQSSVQYDLPRARSGDSLKSFSHFGPEASASTLSFETSASDRSKRFSVLRSMNKEVADDKGHPSDDLTEMMSRASNYMTLAYVKIPSVVLCLSYKGRGDRNIEDVHNFVFRMPALEYRNKTWSNLDLALRLKRDVIKALISHTGAIIGNKITHRRPSRRNNPAIPQREIDSSSPASKVEKIQAPTSSSPTASYRLSNRRTSHNAPMTSAFIAGWGSQTSRARSSSTSLDSVVSPRNHSNKTSDPSES